MVGHGGTWGKSPLRGLGFMGQHMESEKPMLVPGSQETEGTG